MRITQQQLRRIIQEEVTKMMKEGPGRGRHGTDWDYSRGGRGDYPRGGEDEGGDDEDDDKKKGKKLDPNNWWGAIGPDDDDY
jgi:hypothetical protein